jgi:hypothetical protein
MKKSRGEENFSNLLSLADKLHYFSLYKEFLQITLILETISQYYTNFDAAKMCLVDFAHLDVWLSTS